MPSIKIFQIHYNDQQVILLDPAFAPYDNSGPAPELREFEVFQKLHNSPLTKDVSLWGALSWRFNQKTGLTGAELLQTISTTPDVDVFFLNPYPHNEALYQNMWIHGATTHPEFLDLVAAFFDAAGLDKSELTAVSPAAAFSSTNSFIGSAKFWDAYIPFIEDILAKVEANLSSTYKAILHSALADKTNYHGQATYIPFIIERLFYHFLRTYPSIKACLIECPQRESELNIHLRSLRDMKELACQSKSATLATHWVNYRNLYLNATHSQQWLEQHLPVITPKSVASINFLS